MPEYHHIFSPSSAERHLRCVGSLMGEGEGKEAGDSAKEGTAAHKLLELAHYGLDPLSMVDIPITPDLNRLGQPFPVTHEMVQAVRLFQHVAEDLMREFEIKYENCRFEQRVVHPAIPDELFGGTADFVAWTDHVIVVIDFKYGTRPVDAKSEQLTEYLLLALSQHPAATQIRQFVQVIVQPRASFGELIKRYEPDSIELAETFYRLQEQVKLYQQCKDLPAPPMEVLNTGKHCHYCPKLLKCPAQMRDLNEAVKLAEVPFDTIDLSEIESLLYWLERADAIRHFLNVIEKRVLQLAIDGKKVPGKKLVARLGNRDWIPEWKARKPTDRLREITRTLGIPAAEAKTISTISPTQAEKWLKENGAWSTDRKVRDRFEKVVYRKPSGFKLVDDSSSEPEINREMVLEYQQILEENQNG
jgi:hypothetical protein